MGSLRVWFWYECCPLTVYKFIGETKSSTADFVDLICSAFSMNLWRHWVEWFEFPMNWLSLTTQIYCHWVLKISDYMCIFTILQCIKLLILFGIISWLKRLIKLSSYWLTHFHQLFPLGLLLLVCTFKFKVTDINIPVIKYLI